MCRENVLLRQKYENSFVTLLIFSFQEFSIFRGSWSQTLRAETLCWHRHSAKLGNKEKLFQVSIEQTTFKSNCSKNMYRGQFLTANWSKPHTFKYMVHGSTTCVLKFCCIFQVTSFVPNYKFWLNFDKKCCQQKALKMVCTKAGLPAVKNVVEIDPYIKNVSNLRNSLAFWNICYKIGWWTWIQKGRWSCRGSCEKRRSQNRIGFSSSSKTSPRENCASGFNFTNYILKRSSRAV